MKKEYCYCSGADCLLREDCKRHSIEDINSTEPLLWMDGFYNEKTNTCDFMEKKKI